MSYDTPLDAPVTDPLGVVRQSLDGFLEETGGRMGMLMDGSGAVILQAGGDENMDQSAFACLTASHLGATRALASLVGEDEFRGLCHQGEHTSIFVADVVGKVILSILFEGRRPVGQVSREGKRIVSSLEGPVLRLLESNETIGGPLDSMWAAAARDEIDRVFREGV